MRPVRTVPWLTLLALVMCSAGTGLLFACAEGVDPDPPQSGFTEEEIDYFLKVALGSEFGGSAQRVRKWPEMMRLRVHGAPTPADRQALGAVAADVNRIVGRTLVELTDAGSNADIYFLPETEFASVEPNYVPGNLGFFWTWWNGYRINRARILISTTTAQEARSHLIREELTQSLGLMNDTNDYPDSIFYQRWTTTTTYAPIDEALIDMLYRPEVQAGMTRAEVEPVLRRLER